MASKLILKKFAAGSGNLGNGGSEWVYYYDVASGTVEAVDLQNEDQIFKYFTGPLLGADWSLVFAYTPALGNSTNNIDTNTSYYINDQDEASVSIVDYCDGTTYVEVETTNLLRSSIALIDQPTTNTTTLQTYVSKTQTASATQCAVTVNDLEIENVYVTYAGSTADIEIVASGTNTAFTYCLFSSDSSTCQAGSSFTGLDATVDYSITVFVKDSQGFERSESVAIFAQANYADKYIVQFYNRSGELCEAKIQQKGYGGAATFPDAGSNPVSLNYREGSSSDAKYDVIKGSECMVSLMSESSFQFQEIFEAEEDEFRLQYYRASTLIWQGFSKNEGYSEAYADFPYEVQITFIDGLGTLKSKDFIDDSGEIYTGIKTEMDIIKICLLKTLHQLPIWVNIDIFESNHVNKTLATDTPIEQTYIDLKVFNKEGKIDNLYDVLNKVLTSYGAHIFQESGAWHIRSIDDVQNAYDYKEFTPYGDSTGATTYNPNKALTSASADPMRRIDPGARLNIIPGFKNIVLEQQLDQIKNVVSNGDLTLFDIGGYYSNWNDSQGISEINTIEDKDKSYNSIRIIGDAKNDSGGVGVWVDNVYADPQTVTADNAGTSLNVSLDFLVEAKDTDITDIRVVFNIQVGAQWLLATGNWTSIDPGAPSIGYLQSVTNFEEGKVFNVNIKTAPIPSTGYLQIQLYKAEGTGGDIDAVNFSNIKVTPIENNIKLPEKIDLEVPNEKGTYTFKPDPIKLSFSDFTQFENPGSLIKNQRFLNAQGTTATSIWFRSGVQESSEIQNILGERFISNYQSPTQEVQGDIHTINDNIMFSNVIADPNNSGRKFMISQMKTDEKEQIFNITMLELLSEDTSEVYRVLEDGSKRLLEMSSKFARPHVRILES